MPEYFGEFEVHVTVQLVDPASRNRFQDWCAHHQCKPVHIMLAQGEHAEQPMATWWRSRTSLTSVLVEARILEADLQSAGFSVVRIKVEAGLRNQDIPPLDTEVNAHVDSNYFEHHIKLLRDRTASSDRLLGVCVNQSAHLSRNARRDRTHGKEERFVTVRSYRMGQEASFRQLRQLLDSLNEIGEQVLEVDSEYCVFDSNLDLDRGWLPLPTPS
jgi:hypothetical protein